MRNKKRKMILFISKKTMKKYNVCFIINNETNKLNTTLDPTHN